MKCSNRYIVPFSLFILLSPSKDGMFNFLLPLIYIIFSSVGLIFVQMDN